MTKLIDRNTTIPTRKQETFSTAADGQGSVEIHVLQGEREFASGNRTLGKFILDGIPPAPRGVPQIEVTFDIDANGILNVSARDKATNREQKITVTASSGLNESDIKRMVDDAAQNEADDRKRREEVETRNHLDSVVYQTEKLIRENREKIPVGELSEVERELDKAKEALKGTDPAAVAKALEDVTAASHKMAEKMYQAAAQPGPGAAPGADSSSSAPEGDVIDAEIEDK